MMPTVAEKRASSRHTSMLLRMLARGTTLRRGRTIVALVAMVVAAAVTTAMLNLYVEVQGKLRKDFRNYGANIIVAAKDGGQLPSDALTNVRAIVAGQGLAVPFAYVIAQTPDGHSIVVAGTDLEQAHKLDQWWSVTAWPHGKNEALAGVRVVKSLRDDDAIDLKFNGRQIHLHVAGTVTTGAAEDSRIYISMAEFTMWAGVTPSTIEVGASGTPAEITSTIQRITAALPNADVRPVRQIIESEARVLSKTRSTLYFAAVLIILTSALCVLATLIGWVFDRRADFAIMKALGAPERTIAIFFGAEAAALGIVGAVAGFLLGIGIAAWIGRVNFNSTITPQLGLFPTILAGSIAVSLIAAIVPISLLRRVQPAIILRGE